VVAARRYSPDRGDAIWITLDSRTGHEQAGRRPALVLSPRVYNSRVGLALCCPITTRPKGYPFETPIPAELGLSGVVLSDHVKCLDWRARRASFIRKLPMEVVDEVLDKLGTLLRR